MNNIIQQQYLSERLKEKIDIILKKISSIENILLEWLIDGQEKEKRDTYQILKNLDLIINKISIKTRSSYNANQIKKNLISLILKILKSPKYYQNNQLPMNDIQSRSWLITCVCLCNTDCDDVKNTLSYLSDCFSNSQTDNYTKFYAIDGITNCINTEINCYFQECNKFIHRFKICENIPSSDSERIYKHQLLFMIWYIKFKDNSLFNESQDFIQCYKDKIEEIFNNTDNINQLSDLLYSFGCIPVINFVNNIFLLLENTIKDERINKFSRFNIVFYLNLVRSCIAIRFINNETLLKRKEEICSMLFIFFKLLRNYTDNIWNPVKCQILRCFRKYYQHLGSVIVIDNLHNELLDDDINIVTSACKTLQIFYKINNSTNIIIEALNKHTSKLGNEDLNHNITVNALSNSLKWMSFKDSSVLESLEDKMYRGETEQIRNSARRLISEMGGTNAIKKLEARKILKDSYSDRINQSQKDIETMFHTTIIDAKRGFNVSTIMEMFVFFSGIILLMVSGFMAIFRSGDNLSEWAGTAISGTTGALSILYTLFISKPRQKVKENVSHLMYLKVIFLGYLRELNQIDQSFNQHILEEEIISTKKMKFFYTSIDSIMSNCLKLIWANKDDNYQIIKDFVKIGHDKLENMVNGKNIQNESLYHNDNNNLNNYNKTTLTSIELSDIIKKKIKNNDLANKVKENEVNSDVIIEMDAAGWRELGIDPGLNQAKILSNIKREIKNI